jgi:oligoribonuclease NrnB/cAMP/cGMP phosphodiesterase (DHH superfamily)
MRGGAFVHRMKVIIFSHESDLDGLYSAAIGLIRYPQAMTVFLGYGVENFNKLGNFIDSATRHSSFSEVGGKIIIADLGLNDELIETCRKIFSDATVNGWKIMWVDHHPWSDQAVQSVKPFAEIVLDASGRKCAADLVYETLLPGNILAEKLASMAHTMDFFTNDQYLTPISELIRYYQTFPDFYYRLSDLAFKSSKGILWDVGMQCDYNDYVRLRDDAKEQVFASMQIKEAGRFKVAYVPSSPYLQSSLFSQEVFSKTASDVVLLYSAKGKVSIRRNNDAISCRSIAANLPDGGGHDYAAGATFKSDPSDAAAILSELQAAVTKALANK